MFNASRPLDYIKHLDRYDRTTRTRGYLASRVRRAPVREDVRA